VPRREARDITTEIAIIGGGLVGLAAGLALAGLGFATTVVERRRGKAQDDGRTTALLAPAVAFLDRLGVWETAALEATPLERLVLVNCLKGETPADGRSAAFAAGEIGRSAFGWNVANHRLLAGLEAAAEATPNLVRHTGESLEAAGFDASGARLTLTSGRKLRAELAVAADGARSRLREEAGIAAPERDHGQTAIATRFAHSRPHDNTSFELHRPGGPLTTVPLPGRWSSLVWSNGEAVTAELMAGDDAAFAAALGERLSPYLGEIGAVARRHTFPLVTRLAERLTGPHLVVIGEAAHVLSPIGAQGLNLSLRDVEVLRAVMGEALTRGLSPGDPRPLEAYARRRRFDTAARVRGIDLLARSAATAFPPVRLARELGFALVDGVAPLKQSLMHLLMHPLEPPRSLDRLF